MEGLVAALRSLFDWLYSWVPWRIVDQHEQGVKYRLGHIVATLHYDDGIRGSGLHIYLPGISTIEIEDTNLRHAELDWQTCRLKDNTEVTFCLGARFRVRDAGAMYANLHDHLDTVSETIRSAAVEVAETYPGLDAFLASIREDARATAQKSMRGWGIDLKAVTLISCSQAQSLRLIAGD